MGGLLGGCARRDPRPNVLLVVADDWSYPHAGCYGDPFVRTPHFDRVAREGVKFTNSFSCSPSCTPSRSSLLTGRHQWQCGEAGVLYGSIPLGLPIVTHALEDAGYRTGFTGKGWAPGDWKALGLERHPNGQEFNRLKHPGKVPPGIDARDYAANFQEFLDTTNQEKPFFFWLGSTEPHRVYDPEAYRRLDRGLEKIPVPGFLPDSEETRKDLVAYYSEIEWHDRQIGKAMALLGEKQMLDNTLVILTSDNGMPFPRAKVNLYDTGLRMPLAMHWPARLERGITNHALVSHTDITETILEATGVGSMPGSTGNSLLRKPDRPYWPEWKGMYMRGPRGRRIRCEAFERTNICTFGTLRQIVGLRVGTLFRAIRRRMGILMRRRCWRTCRRTPRSGIWRQGSGRRKNYMQWRRILGS
jgi:uncharacterized sulfatase